MPSVDVREVAGALEVPLGGDDRARARRHLDDGGELDRLADRDLGPVAAVRGEVTTGWMPRRSAAVGGTRIWPSTIS